MEEEKTKVCVLMLTDEDRDRLTKITEKAKKVIEEAKSEQEIAWILRVLMETFEESYQCVVPFKGRYTEPVWNYQKGGLE